MWKGFQYIVVGCYLLLIFIGKICIVVSGIVDQQSGVRTLVIYEPANVCVQQILMEGRGKIQLKSAACLPSEVVSAQGRCLFIDDNNL